jgi:hypothetical protein
MVQRYNFSVISTGHLPFLERDLSALGGMIGPAKEPKSQRESLPLLPDSSQFEQKNKPPGSLTRGPT